jgi:uncharacterized membrane protein
MSEAGHRWPPALGLFASLLGLTFAWLSTQDYARHLDRQMHDVHCGFIPGAAEATAENACRTAMFSPYSAILRDQVWGGIPISLFAVGAFTFFAGFCLYLLLAGRSAPRRASQFFGFAALTPLFASIAMFIISATILGEYCKTCIGIYVSSVLLAIAGVAAVVIDARDQRISAAAFRAPAAGAAGVPPTVVDADGRSERLPPRRTGGWGMVLVWLMALGTFTAVPALLYASALPNYSPFLSGCGTLATPATDDNSIRVAFRGAIQEATLVVDPLCPTCKGLHQRLDADGFLEQLDIRFVLFPLDAPCNWNLDRSLHPGACVVSKAVLCNDQQALTVLEWAYDNQVEILETAKGPAGEEGVTRLVTAQFPSVEGCIDSDETSQRLDRMMRFAVDNQLPVSTPQMFVGETRLCSEDSDIGLSYTLGQLAPRLER